MKNAQLISKKEAELYDKFAGFISDIEDINTSWTNSKSYDAAMNKLSIGNVNLIRR